MIVKRERPRGPLTRERLYGAAYYNAPLVVLLICWSVLIVIDPTDGFVLQRQRAATTGTPNVLVVGLVVPPQQGYHTSSTLASQRVSFDGEKGDHEDVAPTDGGTTAGCPTEKPGGGVDDHKIADLASDDDFSIEAFQQAKANALAQQRVPEQGGGSSTLETDESMDEFDGYAFRDVIYEKWGACYDVDFNPVNAFGVQQLYLNILPFHQGSRRFRHESEYDYLCHLQAVVEILQKYGQLDLVLYQISETSKKPRAGTSPLIAVPIRLELSTEQVEEIIRY